ncbi:hypothetical protein [Mucilaginibacter sp. UYCu711]|uniref:hypothetical protein n=1 Tax=Mucilaginibacter sp. UYCu711 TaxID=3156339 RepID=UPI003D1AEC01
MKIFFFILFTLFLSSCVKENVSPVLTEPSDTNTNKIFSGINTSIPDYWFNGTKGSAVVRVICKDCTAIASFAGDAIPFLFNSDGIGYLKYNPAAGTPVYFAVCPGGNKAIKADVYDSKNQSVFSFSGTLVANWTNTFVVK